MKIINLTPHQIRIHDGEKNLVLVVEPSEYVARVATRRTLLGVVQGFPLYGTEYVEVENLPAEAPDTIYVVSGLLRAAVPNRKDLWQPGELLRNEAGQPIGCIGLQQ